MAALSWPHSRQPVNDLNGDLLRGARLQFFRAGGTTSPIVAYSDSALTVPLPSYPDAIVSDASGRWPRVYLPFGIDFRERVTGPQGDLLWDDDNISNPAPPEDDPSEPTTRLVQTGMIIPSLALLPSCVALNGQTIGNALSGAIGRASDDTLALFTFVYNALPDVLAPVPGGRSGTPSVDFAAGKVITLPDFRGRALVGVSGMGSGISTILDGVTWDGSGGNNLPGSTAGAAFHALVIGEMPNHRHDATSVVTDPQHDHASLTGTGFQTSIAGAASHDYLGGSVATSIDAKTAKASTGITVATTLTFVGGGTGHLNVQPSSLVVYNIAL